MNIHFNSTRLGQGANMALPIFGKFMQSCLKSDTYGTWNKLTFPIPQIYYKHEEEFPVFKDHLNFIDKITNRKLEKVKRAEAPQDIKKESFLKRLFKRKKNKSEKKL